MLGASILVGALALAQLATEDAAAPLREIEIRSDASPAQLEQVRDLVVLELGAPLSNEAVRRTLANLYATGVAKEVELSVRRRDDGLVATLVIWGNSIVEDVRLSGELGLKRSQLAAVAVSGKGKPLVEERVLKTVFALQDLYRAQGYFEPKVKVAIDYLDTEQRRAILTYRLESGQRALFGEVEFDGEISPFTPNDLRKWLDLPSGTPYRRRVVDEAAERLRRKLLSLDYRRARVEAQPQLYDDTTRQMKVAFRVDVGPQLEVLLIGGDRKNLEEKGLLPFLGEQGYDDALVRQSIQRLRTYFQERGFYDVDVTSRTEEREGSELLVLTIELGSVRTLESVRFEGNSQISSEELSRRITTVERKTLSPGSGKLVTEVLDADLRNLRAFYALQGFPDARVGPVRIDRLEDQLSLVIPIVEGRRQTVSMMSFEGFSALTPASAAGKSASMLEELLANSGLLWAGGPFHPSRLDDSLRLLRLRYEELGYQNAQVSAETAWEEPTGDDAAGTVALRFRALEGWPTVVDRIILRGNLRTRAEVVRRAAGIATGDPISQSRLLEAQRKLYRLGAFSSATVKLAPSEAAGRTRDIVVDLEEGKSRRVQYGFGYDSEDGLRGLLGLSHANLFGRGFTLGTNLRYSERDQRARLTLFQPYLGRYELPVTYSLFYIDERRPSFDVTRLGARVEAYHELAVRERGGSDHAGKDRIGLVFDYRRVRPELRIDPREPTPELERQDQAVRIASLIPNAFFDRRNDLLDPTRGWSSFLQLQAAFPFLSTTEEFFKVSLQQTHYLEVGARARYGVLAGSVRLGGIEPRSSTGGSQELLPNQRVSIAERFFAGGSTSHRAYGLDELGIAGSTLLEDDAGKFRPVGGNGLVLINLDYRFPIFGGFGGVVFADAGNVWADWRDLDPGELELGLGAGVRYLSPVGPLRLEIGWKADPDDSEDRYRIFLSVGNPF